MRRKRELTPDQKNEERQRALARIEELERKASNRLQSVIYQTFAGPYERENEKKEAEEITRLKKKISLLK